MIASLQNAYPTDNSGWPKLLLGSESASGAESGSETPDSRKSVQKEAVANSNFDVSTLPPEDQAVVRKLKIRDQEVRNHEAAHISAGGPYVRGGAVYSYATGPDGKRYAVGGEVSIDVSAVSDDPEATAAKMRVVKQAALAPANPSGADISAAARASQTEAAARIEAAEKAKQEVAEKAGASGDEKQAGLSGADSGDAENSRTGAVAPEAFAGELVDVYA